MQVRTTKVRFFILWPIALAAFSKQQTARLPEPDQPICGRTLASKASPRVMSSVGCEFRDCDCQNAKKTFEV